MATLLLDRAGLRVRSEGRSLALYEGDERRGTVPLHLIDRCIIQGAQTQLDSGVLLKLAEAGVTTVVFSPRRTRRVATVLGPAHNDAAIRLAQALKVTDLPWCAEWAAHTVRAKVRRQVRVLQTWRAARPDARKPLTDALARLQGALAALSTAPEHGEPSTLAVHTLARLRGLEGAAARAHFQALAALVPPVLGFAGRNRRPPRDPVNAALSLGYGLLHTEAVHACQISGLDPLLGFYHRPAIGRESLASDLIEPLRPRIDQWVQSLLASRRLRAEHFTEDRGACLLGKAGREAFFSQWSQEAEGWRRVLRRSTAHLARHLRGQGLAWIEADSDDVADHPLDDMPDAGHERSDAPTSGARP
jgi:CRISPR-associated protein Cas1